MPLMLKYWRWQCSSASSIRNSISVADIVLAGNNNRALPYIIVGLRVIFSAKYATMWRYITPQKRILVHKRYNELVNLWNNVVKICYLFLFDKLFIIILKDILSRNKNLNLINLSLKIKCVISKHEQEK